MKVSKTLWNAAIMLLQLSNPDASLEKLEAIAQRGFALCVNPNEYINYLMGL